ncbi:MAG TPA: hypothetical protein VE664_07365 [Actinomycetes bacterium]|jgi:hypothetical protein|nr:hypothetical protein [Actinomycetes bacterium]
MGAAAWVSQRPRPAGPAELRRLLEAAWAGERPAATPDLAQRAPA